MPSTTKRMAIVAIVFALYFQGSSTSSVDYFDNDCIGCLGLGGYFCVSGSFYTNDCDSSSYSSYSCTT